MDGRKYGGGKRRQPQETRRNRPLSSSPTFQTEQQSLNSGRSSHDGADYRTSTSAGTKERMGKTMAP